MQGLTHRWVRRSESDLGPGMGSGVAVVPCAVGAGVSPLVARVLASRGMVEEEEVRAFCNPSLRQLHEPSLMAGLERAAGRVLMALERGEKIVIYGDYDVDGLCASAILFHTLSALGGGSSRVETYVPHRLDEGYGLHVEAMEQLAAAGAKLVVSVDCGVTGFAAASRVRELGMDLIITDHHALPPEEKGLPEAYSVVHPRLRGEDGSTYPWGELCGAGVAFKLAWRLATMRQGSERVSPEMRDLLLEMLGLAALGTIADVVPLQGENRIIARFGLSHLKRSKLVGVRALLEASSLDGEEIDSERAGFALAPRLNACGRMGHAKDALEMLTVAPPERARAIARDLNQHNADRRETEQTIFEQACEAAERAGMTSSSHRAIVLADERWHAGVVGIVCSRLIGKFHRPTLLLQRGSETSHGSGRSIDGFNLHAGLSGCGDILEKFGGHDMAAGLVVRNERLEEFVARFVECANAGVSQEMLTPALKVDADATIEELDSWSVKQLSALGPFGRGNPRPCVVLRGVRALRDAEVMGKNGAHLNVQVGPVDGGGKVIRLVGWRWGDRRSALRAGTALDVAVHPKVSVWNGIERVEGEICDVLRR
ncbi:MAG: single-stranded-DNA-specific exonuclease RecJ [Phycisphaerales bacterium]